MKRFLCSLVMGVSALVGAAALPTAAHAQYGFQFRSPAPMNPVHVRSFGGGPYTYGPGSYVAGYGGYGGGYGGYGGGYSRCGTCGGYAGQCSCHHHHHHAYRPPYGYPGPYYGGYYGGGAVYLPGLSVRW
jgi:hypothetical protein